MSTLSQLLTDKRLVVVTGTGGVGKTTLSATLAVKGAQLGKKTLVVTIDPAQRLKDLLGLTEADTQPKRVTTFSEPVYAMILDMGRAWDDLILRMSADKKQAQAIFDNRFYRYFTRDVVGSQEFIACDILYELASLDYDLIILDTPPAQHAIDFLDAPNRILSFIDQKAFHVLSKPPKSRLAQFGLRLVGRWTGLMQPFAEKLVGGTLLRECIEFWQLSQVLFTPIVERTKAFQQMLQESHSAFVVVTTPHAHAMAEASVLIEQLRKRQLRLSGLVLNNVLSARIPKPPYPAETALWDAVLQAVQVREQAVAVQTQLVKKIDAFGVESVVHLPHLGAQLSPVEGVGVLCGY